MGWNCKTWRENRKGLKSSKSRQKKNIDEQTDSADVNKMQGIRNALAKWKGVTAEIILRQNIELKNHKRLENEQTIPAWTTFMFQSSKLWKENQIQ